MSNRLERGTYIGGHEVSAICGMNPYSGIADAYAHIVLGHREDIGEKPAVRRGLIVEPGFVDWLEKKWGLSLERDVFVQDADVPYLAGTLDARETRENGDTVVHEFTTTTEAALQWQDHPLWTEDEPAKYKWVQVQHYMAIDNAVSGWIHLFIADTGEIRHYEVTRSEGAIEELRDEVESFWLDHVLTETPPIIDTATTKADVAEDMVRLLYPESDGEHMVADAELVDLALSYSQSRDNAKVANEEKKRYSAAIRQALGAHERADFAGGYVSWKNSKGRASTDWQALAQHLMQDMSDEDRAGHIGNATTTKPGARVLRVHFKKEKKKK